MSLALKLSGLSKALLRLTWPVASQMVLNLLSTHRLSVCEVAVLELRFGTTATPSVSKIQTDC